MGLIGCLGVRPGWVGFWFGLGWVRTKVEELKVGAHFSTFFSLSEYLKRWGKGGAAAHNNTKPIYKQTLNGNKN